MSYPSGERGQNEIVFYADYLVRQTLAHPGLKSECNFIPLSRKVNILCCCSKNDRTTEGQEQAADVPRVTGRVAKVGDHPAIEKASECISGWSFKPG